MNDGDNSLFYNVVLIQRHSKFLASATVMKTSCGELKMGSKLTELACGCAQSAWDDRLAAAAVRGHPAARAQPASPS